MFFLYVVIAFRCLWTFFSYVFASFYGFFYIFNALNAFECLLLVVAVFCEFASAFLMPSDAL